MIKNAAKLMNQDDQREYFLFDKKKLKTKKLKTKNKKKLTPILTNNEFTSTNTSTYIITTKYDKIIYIKYFWIYLKNIKKQHFIHLYLFNDFIYNI